MRRVFIALLAWIAIGCGSGAPDKKYHTVHYVKDSRTNPPTCFAMWYSGGGVVVDCQRIPEKWLTEEVDY